MSLCFYGTSDPFSGADCSDPPCNDDRWLGLDIGGANIKASDGKNVHRCWPFALWKTPELLQQELRHIRSMFPGFSRFAVTMTGELADGYATKIDGVQRIVSDCCAALAAEKGDSGSRVLFYSQRGDFVDRVAATNRPLEIAAANWHATALRILLAFSENGKDPMGDPSESQAIDAVVLDLGSTTLDLTPLAVSCQPGRCMADLSLSVDGLGGPMTDFQRLSGAQLVYSGVGRSPVSSLVDEVNWGTVQLPLAQEAFATTKDVYLLTGDVEPDPEDLNTSDGRAADISGACQRMARMLCSDKEELPMDLILRMAATAKQCQVDLIQRALELRFEKNLPLAAILCGEGEFLLKQVLNQYYPSVAQLSLSEMVGSSVAAVFPAFAVSQLASITRGA